MAHNKDFIRNAHLARWRKVILYLKSCPLSSEATSSMWTWSHSWEMKGKQICMRCICFSGVMYCVQTGSPAAEPQGTTLSEIEILKKSNNRKAGTGHCLPGAFNTGGENIRKMADRTSPSKPDIVRSLTLRISRRLGRVHADDCQYTRITLVNEHLLFTWDH